MKYFLFKSEPSTYSISDLERDRETWWNGVRNYQARNELRKARPGDKFIIYHSGDERACVGIGVIMSEPSPEEDKKRPGDWVQLRVRFFSKLVTPVSLVRLKSEPALKDLPLIRQSRLSSMEITKSHWDRILELGK